MSRPAFPKVNGAGLLKAAVLNQCSNVLWLTGKLILCPNTMLGLFGVPVFAKSVAM
jgi:hypothetical protein